MIETTGKIYLSPYFLKKEGFTMANPSSHPHTYTPLFPQVNGLLHGGDYNPDQWPEEILDQDIPLVRSGARRGNLSF